jgi:hypothetical protein
MTNKKNQQRFSIAPSQAVTMEDAELNDALLVLQSVKEARKRGRPPTKQTEQPPSSSSYAAAVCKETATKKGPPKGNKKQQGQKSNAGQTKKEENASQRMRKEIAEMRKEIDELKKQLAQVLSKQTTASVTQTLRTVNVVASDAQERARRSKNVIIRGIHSAKNEDEDDSTAVRAFLAAVCPDINVENAKLQRLQNSRPRENDESASSRNPVPSVLVVLNSVEEQQTVLKAARHHDNPEFKGVFAHEDRTRAQQLQYSECAKQAKDKNKRLESVELLNKPFRFVVRGDRVRCIDFIKSSVGKKSVYVDDRTVQLDIQQRQQQKLDEAINNGHVNDRRSHTAAVSTAAAAGED